MKVKIPSLLALSFSLYSSSAQQILSDDFNGSSVDMGLWNTILPFSQSQISESGGMLATTGRGTLATASGFSSPFTVSGNVAFNNFSEIFNVTLRSDLSTSQALGLSPYNVLTGIAVQFSVAGNQISIQQINATDENPPFLALTNFSFSINRPYDFSVTDTGDRIDFSIDGIDLLSADTVFGTGDRMAFYSREFPETSSSLDFVSIQPVPEPSSFTLAAIGILIMMRAHAKAKT